MSQIDPNPNVVETTNENFVTEVVERSKSVPVVVDFWAEWCQPCRILGPTLEKLAAEYGGRFVLAKADTEQLSQVASGFGVRSIPAVFAVKGGEVVDSFVGVMPEAAIRAWLDRLMPTPAESLVIEARALETTDSTLAEKKYREALSLEPANVSAKIGLARTCAALGRPSEAQEIIANLERRGYLEPEAENLKAKLTLHSGETETIGDVSELRMAHAANPGDKTSQLELAEALAASSEYAEALELALNLVESDRRGTGEQGRKLMIAIFQLLPADSELANDYRRRLSVAL